MARKAPLYTRSSGGRRRRLYEVEKICDMQIIGGKKMYRVRWKGFKAADDTWEEEKNMEKCPDAVLKFLDSLKHKKRAQPSHSTDSSVVAVENGDDDEAMHTEDDDDSDSDTISLSEPSSPTTVTKVPDLPGEWKQDPPAAFDVVFECSDKRRKLAVDGDTLFDLRREVEVLRPITSSKIYMAYFRGYLTSHPKFNDRRDVVCPYCWFSTPGPRLKALWVHLTSVHGNSFAQNKTCKKCCCPIKSKTERIHNRWCRQMDWLSSVRGLPCHRQEHIHDLDPFAIP